MAKKKYYTNKFEKVRGNIKKTWELINDLRGKSKPNVKASFIIGDKIVTDRREIAQKFNIFFSSVAHKLNAKVYSSTLLSEKPEHNFKYYLNHKKQICDSIFMYSCTKVEIAEIIKGLENGKASDIPISLIKKCSLTLLELLYRFIEYFLNNGIFPNILKQI